MGLDYYTARFLLQARRGTGGSPPHPFGAILTIGRQNFVPTRPQLDDLAARFNFDAPKFLSAHTPAQLNYIEPFLLDLCAATSVESIDASPYENATHIHDLNTPLPDPLAGRFDTVIEAGSLEHIFHFPQAIANLMRALKPGGRLFIQTPANNYFGHGFYQFSPELFYRVLSPANGFAITRMRLLEHFYPCHFFATQLYEITDPAQIRKRVQLINNKPALLLIDAQKTADVAPFSTPPQQSDYLPLWQEAQPRPQSQTSNLKSETPLNPQSSDPAQSQISNLKSQIPLAPNPHHDSRERTHLLEETKSWELGTPSAPARRGLQNSKSELPPCLQTTPKHKIYALPLKLISALLPQRLGNRQDPPTLANQEFFKETE